mmetsp:Transcript_39959/g.83924  ORF Transcript_39959/g.83924 Transcript_39959/m.83924 type:complete len:415 (-) Transcript_39959:213-1457(-)
MYAHYKCGFEYSGKQYTCYIIKDVDEEVALRDADPRARLFEAIEQDAPVNHLAHLAEFYKIDVDVFLELVAAKTLKYASYHASAWLKRDWNFDILNAKDSKGNNFLHSIAESKHAARFFEKAGEVSLRGDRNRPDWKLDLHGFDNQSLFASNNDGENWLQVLVRRGDDRALDFALSPFTGFAWEIAYEISLPLSAMDELSVSIKNSGDIVMQCIYDSFVAFRTMFWQCSWGNFRRASREELLQNESMAGYRGDGASKHAEQVARFYIDWGNYYGCQLTINPFTSLVENGYFDIFSLLYHADERLFLNEVYRIPSKEDRNDYIQPQLCPLTNDHMSYDWLEFDIYTCLIVGGGGQDTSRKLHICEKDYYFKCLQKHTVSCNSNECPSWLSHIKGMKHYYGNDTSYSGAPKRKYWE